MKAANYFLIGVLCFVFITLGTEETRAQQSSGEAFAREFRDHVVKIRTTWTDGQQQDGFGFVVGQSATGVYIVTANHVVRGSRPGEVAESVELTWFRRRGEQFPAKLIGTADADRDIAVLRTDLPSGVRLRPELMMYPRDQLQRGTQAWFVGRAGDWYVPFQPGTVNSVDLNDQILIDGLNLQVGTSGAPLTTAWGVAGVIVEDSGGVARATAIGFVARAFEAWAHPWGMTSADGEWNPGGPDLPNIDVTVPPPAAQTAPPTPGAEERGNLAEGDGSGRVDDIGGMRLPPPVASEPMQPILPICRVYDVRPPDDWLALRSEPSSKNGRRLSKLESGVEFVMLGERVDSWYLVEVSTTGEIGWLSWAVDRWIRC